MSSPHFRAPHSTGAYGPPSEALNAALLIDFDNVTMGMRSDLSKELATLLESDIIKGKVTVQRAYADWRRYPQYIVPLSENSVDLIFAPAYGSSKKNATDIRMAIDAMELVFIRPEIGTYILLTGDSDFSSVVLKLKEYGKYVIGVGIQESSSDILVQNCDEYYSYTSLTGLRKTTDTDNKPVDPWVLVEQAAARMASRDDVMRSDRLKQVMIEIDPTFDEGNFGFSKFSRFLSEAGSRNLVQLKKLENGQYEVLPAGGASKSAPAKGRDSGRRTGGRGRSSGRDQEERTGPTRGRAKPKEETQLDASAASPAKEKAETPPRGRGGAKAGKEPEKGPSAGSKDPMGSDDPLKKAYGILREALAALSKGDGASGSVRDSDLKRKMLRLDSSFDEGDLGFGKFSRFLRQAHDHEVVDLEKRPEGTYQVSAHSPADEKEATPPAPDTAEEKPETKGRGKPKADQKEEKKPIPEASEKIEMPRRAVGVRRGGGRGRKGLGGPPPLLEGQVVATSDATGSTQQALPLEDEGAAPEVETKAKKARTPRGRRGKPASDAKAKSKISDGAPDSSTAPSTEAPTGASTPATLDIGALGLPSDGAALIRYLTNSYKGVGQKTAERVVAEFGSNLFEVLHKEPGRLQSVLKANRVDQLVEGWKVDLARRLGTAPAEETTGTGDGSKETGAAKRRSRKGTRRPRGGGTAAG
jgi:uncharacterized protein (TIGR00288 family)